MPFILDDLIGAVAEFEMVELPEHQPPVEGEGASISDVASGVLHAAAELSQVKNIDNTLLLARRYPQV